MDANMSSIQVQQVDALLVMGIPVNHIASGVSMASTKVDFEAFKKISCWLGLLLGILSVGADLGGHVFLFQQKQHVTFLTLFAMMALWSTVVSLVMFGVFSMMRYLIEMLRMNPTDDGQEDAVLEAFDDRCLAWIVIGICGSYTSLNLVFLTWPFTLLSIGGMVITVGVYSLLLKCCCEAPQKKPNILVAVESDGQTKVQQLAQLLIV